MYSEEFVEAEVRAKKAQKALEHMRVMHDVKWGRLNRNMKRAPAEKAHRYADKMADLMLELSQEYFKVACAEARMHA